MKTLESLKSKELKVALYIVKLTAFIKLLDDKVNAYAKRSIKSLRDELWKQRVLRESRLYLLGLEAARIRGEIEELSDAHDKHGDTLDSM